MPDTALDRSPAWLPGRGRGPQLQWHVQTAGTLSSLAYSREAGDLFTGNQSGQLSRIDERGQLAAITQLPGKIVALSWSDDGSRGAAIIDDGTVLRLDHNLQVIQTLTPPEPCLSIAVSPYGNHLAVGLANGTTQIYGERKRRLAHFETIRPLSFLKFCTTEPILFGAADLGLICCHHLKGASIWQQSTWSNVGRMCTTGDGHLLYLASFSHGVQALDGDGQAVGSYILEGTVHRVDTSYESQRLVAATVERSLFWLNASGELLWSTVLNDDVVDVVCDPLGAWVLCGLAQQGIYRLVWVENRE